MNNQEISAHTINRTLFQSILRGENMSKKKHSVDVENDQHKQSGSESSEHCHDSKSDSSMKDCD